MFLEEKQRNISSDQSIKVEADTGLNTTNKGVLMILLIGCSFLVFNVGGYNNFIPTNLILLTRICVVLVLLLSTVILYQSKRTWKRHWRISFSFLIASIGLLLSWFFGRWYQLIPGLSTSTVDGIAVAKLAEVLPVVLSILVGTWLVEKDFTPIYLRGGDLKKSLKLGLLGSPVALIPFVALGGLGLYAGLDVITAWMPWMCLFAFSNAFMEELMIRGLFLKKFEVIFGERQSLLLTSLVFGMLHTAIIEYTDIVTFSVFLGITFVLGLVWGYVMQKSDNIWGAVLAHAIADILFILTVFGV